MIESTCFQSSIGFVSILAVKEGVVKISFENESKQMIEKWCRNHLGMGIFEVPDFITEVKSQILNYLSGKRKSLNFPVIHLNTPFHKRVLEAEKNIPYGQTRSYGEVAKMVGSSNASRAVGSANANNPLPLYFPCHRIINSNGTLGGFGGGLKIKEFLLDLEKNNRRARKDSYIKSSCIR
jgi:methylated-DNA-[protein]-cysteine S-methyltransferase